MRRNRTTPTEYYLIVYSLLSRRTYSLLAVTEIKFPKSSSDLSDVWFECASVGGRASTPAHFIVNIYRMPYTAQTNWSEHDKCVKEVDSNGVCVIQVTREWWNCFVHRAKNLMEHFPIMSLWWAVAHDDDDWHIHFVSLYRLVVND